MFQENELLILFWQGKANTIVACMHVSALVGAHQGQGGTVSRHLPSSSPPLTGTWEVFFVCFCVFFCEYFFLCEYIKVGTTVPIKLNINSYFT